MTFVNHLWNLGSALGVGWMIVAALLARASVLDSPKGSDPRARFRFAFSLFGFFAVLLLASAATAAWHGQSAAELRVATGLVGTLAGVGLVSVVVFEGLVRRVRPNIPRIVPDVLTTIAGLVALMRASSHLGLDLSGIIATSAVLTAVIGLSLQDTLGNLFAGLALQVQQPFEVGDWIQFDQDVTHTGEVVEINWRATRIITIDRKEFPVPKGAPRRGDGTYVYFRDTCLRCGTPTGRLTLAGRDCYYCPACQPA